MARITGIGGVFLRAKSDEKALAAWYHEHLGLPLEAWGGAALKWPADPGTDGGSTAWHVASPGSAWFPGGVMINYRVDHLDDVIARLRAGGIDLLAGPEHHDNGSFAWLLDPDGNKVELWEPKAWNPANKR